VARVRRTVASIGEDRRAHLQELNAASNCWDLEGIESVPLNYDRGSFLLEWGESARGMNGAEGERGRSNRSRAGEGYARTLYVASDAVLGVSSPVMLAARV
jgi:hypothetical protein